MYPVQSGKIIPIIFHRNTKIKVIFNPSLSETSNEHQRCWNKSMCIHIYGENKWTREIRTEQLKVKSSPYVQSQNSNLQELLTLPEHLSSPPVFSGVRVTRSLVLYVCFVDRCLSFCTFFAIVLSVLLRYTDSDRPFGIFKLFFLRSRYSDLKEQFDKYSEEYSYYSFCHYLEMQNG